MENIQIRKDDTEKIELFGEPEEEPVKTNKKKKPPKKSKTARIVLLCILGTLLLVLIGLTVFAWHVCNKPGVFFEKVAIVTATPTPAVTPMIDVEKYLPTEEPGATPLPIFSPTELPAPTPAAEGPAPAATALPEDPNRLSGIVNVALFGIDAREDGTTTSGSMPHSDANLVLAINFDTKEISLISIARDCLTTAPGHMGFYKFNGVFNVGGGMKDPKAGFELSCRAAEEWIGGVSIPYYYGVDFQALIDLVDMIGGIDFDVDIKLYLADGRRIYPGRRHLDGMGVMAYMRMRKTAGGSDAKRTARQRKMLVAIFKKLKKEGKLSMVPDILKTLGDNVYTNVSSAQTAALVNFASEIDPDTIKTYSIQGSIRMKYDWAFCFIDQQARIDLLRTVYGITANPIGFNSYAYEDYLHEYGLKALQYLTVAKRIVAVVHGAVDADTMTEAQKQAYAVCWKDLSGLQEAYNAADQWMRAHYDGVFTDGEKQEYRACMRAIQELENRLKTSGDALNAAFGNPVKAKWNNSLSDWYGKECLINDVYVDFR